MCKYENQPLCRKVENCMYEYCCILLVILLCCFFFVDAKFWLFGGYNFQKTINKP